jgi:hypothetical protein
VANPGRTGARVNGLCPALTLRDSLARFTDGPVPRRGETAVYRTSESRMGVDAMAAPQLNLSPSPPTFRQLLRSVQRLVCDW